MVSTVALDSANVAEILSSLRSFILNLFHLCQEVESLDVKWVIRMLNIHPIDTSKWGVPPFQKALSVDIARKSFCKGVNTIWSVVAVALVDEPPQIAVPGVKRFRLEPLSGAGFTAL